MQQTKPVTTWQATAYKAPLLRVYGGMQQLTAGGTGATQEGMKDCTGAAMRKC